MSVTAVPDAGWILASSVAAEAALQVSWAAAGALV